MTDWPWCEGVDKTTAAYKSNTAALYVTFSISIFICCFYILASLETLGRVGNPTRGEQIFQANLLSGLLASLLAISLLYSQFPEPIEATFSVTLALSQASGLGWLDFSPESNFMNVLAARGPDIFALAMSLWASQQAQEKWFDDNPGSRTKPYPPMVFRNPWLPFAIFSGVNEVSMFLTFVFCKVLQTGRRNNQRATRYCALMCTIFVASSLAGVGLGMYVAYWGCWPFTLALWMAPIAVFVGGVFAIFQTMRRVVNYSRTPAVLGRPDR